ncbi:hypothetical protein EIN_097660 [Entamoeba invadens IP1]|uniref:Uncharacterized protein n=1 Tax=Entamoeba invadens IP1 TaxID=370355 RepID=A0A0A1U0Q3_ENTIV|nr:hypothetical protein EIN_097660 [Entamoeba invadens IP1]ELP87479.1 hypothetical protein EIN_097660 [Entamoeba invadens IP1]|eukprot:XP_004254250.1 hypothetical protein EIN_097660 [Entamoeba invadens IP1]
MCGNVVDGQEDNGNVKGKKRPNPNSINESFKKEINDQTKGTTSDVHKNKESDSGSNNSTSTKKEKNKKSQFTKPLQNESEKERVSKEIQEDKSGEEETKEAQPKCIEITVEPVMTFEGFAVYSREEKFNEKKVQEKKLFNPLTGSFETLKTTIY